MTKPSFWRDLIAFICGWPHTRPHYAPIPLDARLREVRAAIEARDTRRTHYAIEGAKRARTRALARELGREFFQQ